MDYRVLLCALIVVLNCLPDKFQDFAEYIDGNFSIGGFPTSVLLFMILPILTIYYYRNFLERTIDPWMHPKIPTSLTKAYHLFRQNPWLSTFSYVFIQLLVEFLKMAFALLFRVFAGVSSIARRLGPRLAARYNLAQNRRGGFVSIDTFLETSVGCPLRERFQDQRDRFDSLVRQASQQFSSVLDLEKYHLSTRRLSTDNVDIPGFSPLHLSPLHSPWLLPGTVVRLAVPRWKQLLFGVDCTAIAERETVEHLSDLADQNDAILNANEKDLQKYVKTCDEMICSIERSFSRRPGNPFANASGDTRYSQDRVRRHATKPKIVTDTSYDKLTWWLNRGVKSFRRADRQSTPYRLPVHRVQAIAAECNHPLSVYG
ncbi:hypothetical protein CONLIGDRAFT_637333 [Coniochaeta ligniaria NRRL 30616]|uniref:Uncharacterized protein n=1 Tax=Coniochaeta ligniaria NRRL 30616 TaxID=1408157 RepID=A0A1J7J2P0_9PEZI|nr:hypothetical protein CONLIGDRAFT_637333 [Coniochaeta ligniaria NRRL 30616]